MMLLLFPLGLIVSHLNVIVSGIHTKLLEFR